MNILRIFLLPLVMLLSACQILQGKPVAAPPPADHALEITYAQATALEKFGTVSVTVHGSPDDAERAIQQKADAGGARYYVIVMKTDTTLPGMWHARAVLYR
ncbi:biofilm peroxide resistance protein BsmA [Brenneria izbisi]|uniref:Biofilm peroxide resistance protein BsmA n=1 Tax=Brenneria izbisi TaxID=2939450 RepID=A0AA41Y0L7_9GAMM|nr:biofilm peroxide resistance protein BsmA [Brenneria izbisi]MCV9878487.1 biofilm peroxide resistance protein BsmA [Brenneria izbisi]MCV9881910.1 biofilm peroxide resistance protein BsmA [Brenneria izbisi]